MRKMRALFLQGASYCLGLGALSEWGHPVGLFQAHHTTVAQCLSWWGPSKSRVKAMGGGWSVAG